MPFVLGDLTVNYAERRVILAGRPVYLVPMEYRMVAELSANAGRVLTHQHFLNPVWGRKSTSELRSMRTIVRRVRRRLADDAGNPTYAFTQPRVGYRMPKGGDGEAERGVRSRPSLTPRSGLSSDEMGRRLGLQDQLERQQEGS